MFDQGWDYSISESWIYVQNLESLMVKVFVTESKFCSVLELYIYIYTVKSTGTYTSNTGSGSVPGSFNHIKIKTAQLCVCP